LRVFIPLGRQYIPINLKVGTPVNKDYQKSTSKFRVSNLAVISEGRGHGVSELQHLFTFETYRHNTPIIVWNSTQQVHCCVQNFTPITDQQTAAM